MAKHCPNCNYSSDEWSDSCPICGKPLLNDEEVRKGWGRIAGNPDAWGRRWTRANKYYLVIMTVFTVVAVLYYAKMLKLLF